jgi:GNAT superfamily N-acetyltransferase
LCPYSKDAKLKQGLVEFYKGAGLPSFCSKDIEDVYVATVPKPNGEPGYAAAFSFVVFEVHKVILAYIVYAFVTESHRRQGIFKRFIASLKFYLIQEKKKCIAYDSAYILAGMWRKTRPHNVYSQVGFSELIPRFLRPLKCDSCDMATLEVGEKLTAKEEVALAG